MTDAGTRTLEKAAVRSLASQTEAPGTILIQHDIADPFYVAPCIVSCTGCPVCVNSDGWNATWAPNAFVLRRGPVKLLQATSQHSSTAGSRPVLPVRSGGALKQPTSIIQLLGEARDVGVTLLRWAVSRVNSIRVMTQLPASCPIAELHSRKRTRSSKLGESVLTG